MHAEPLEEPVAPSGESALDDRDPTDALAEEFVARLRRGERPTVDEYARKHPDHADSIRRVFPAMLLLESAVAKPRQRRQSIPDRLGDYRLKRMIGSGGMGAVYEAIQEPLGRRVAVKILSALRPDDPALPARFEREARTAARLHHPAIVPVYGVGEQDGVYFYVMQLIDGCGADVVIGQIARSRSDAGRSGGSAAATQAVAAFSARSAERDGAVEIREREDTSTGAAATTGVADSLGPNSDRYFRNVARMGAQAAAALAYAHAHGVLHRDVKPSNLLLDGQGNAFLTDFGLAKVVGDEDLTRTGVVVGTPRYMAPERLGSDPLDSVAGDIYGLGATLYELATLRPLFEDRRREALLARIRDEEPAAPRKLEPRIPRDLETVLLKSIAKDPAKRYAGAAEFADDLAACAENRPIRARRQSALGQAASWAKRHPLAATLAAALVLSLAGGLVTVSALWRRSEFHRIEANDLLNVAKNQAKAAEQSQALAEKQRDAARANLKTGLAAIEAMLVRTGADTLRDAPGSKPLRRELLSTAVRFCEDFMARHGDEPSVRSEAARTRVLLASLMEGLGEYDRAEEEFIAAQKLLRLHLAENPKDLPGQSMLALADRHLARLKTTADPDDLAARVSQIDLSIAMIERLAEENPEDLGLKHSLALSIQAQASIHQMRGDRETALVGQTRALEIIEDLLAWRPTLPAFRETMARALSNQGMFLVDLGRPAEAKGSLERSKRMFRDLLREKAPQNGWYSSLSMTERNLARVYRAEGRKKDAEAEYDAAVRNSERLVRQDPDVPDYRTHLATALRFRARFLESENRSDEALRDFEQFRELMELALRTGEPNPQSRYEFARTLSAIGEAHLKKGRTTEAEKAFVRSRELLTALLTQSPGESRFLAETAEAWRDLGRTAMRKENHEEAERCMRRGLEVRRQAAAGAKPGSPEQCASLDQRLWLAHAIERSGKFGPAIDEYGGLSAESGGDARLQGEIVWRLGTMAFHAKTTPEVRTKSFTQIALATWRWAAPRWNSLAKSKR